MLGNFTTFLFFLKVGARTNDHQLPRYQKMMLLKSLDVASAHRAAKLPYTCATDDGALLHNFLNRKNSGPGERSLSGWTLIGY